MVTQLQNTWAFQEGGITGATIAAGCYIAVEYAVKGVAPLAFQQVQALNIGATTYSLSYAELQPDGTFAEYAEADDVAISGLTTQLKSIPVNASFTSFDSSEWVAVRIAMGQPE